MTAPDESSNIRLARLDDVEAIARCAVAAYTIYVDLLGRDPTPMHEDYRALVEQSRVHVVEHGGDIVGFIVIFRHPDHLMLDNAALLPEWQGKALGRRLLQFAEDLALHHGLKRLRLHTNARMARNIELYSKSGFCVVERKLESGIDRVYMEKSL